MDMGFDDHDLARIKNRIQGDLIPIQEIDIHIDNIDCAGDFLYYSISPIGLTSKEYIDESKLFSGRLPLTDNEVVISKYMDRLITHNGLNGRKPDSSLNETLVINGNTYNITGIMNVDIDKKYDPLKESNDLIYEEDFIEYLHRDVIAVMIMNDIKRPTNISIENNPMIIENFHPQMIEEVQIANDLFEYKKIDEQEGLIISTSYFISILEGTTYGDYIDGTYCKTYKDVLDFYLKGTDHDFLNISLYYEKIIENISVFSKVLEKIDVSSMNDKKGFRVVGIFNDYNEESSLSLMTEEAFSNYFDSNIGLYSSVLYEKTKDFKYKSLNDLIGNEFSYVDIDAYVKTKECLKSMNRMIVPLLIVSILMIIVPVGMLVVYINQTLIGKSNFIAVLKMLGISNHDLSGIVILGIIPIVAFIGLLTIILSFPLFNVVQRTFTILYHVRIVIKWIYYLYLMIGLMVLSVFMAINTIKKMNKMNLREMFHFI